jgi:CheY-like chemotaxis protein
METQPRNILVVEDEGIMRESLVDWFTSEGRTVDAAVDGEEALSRFDLEQYDAMIIDLKLPGRDGLDVLAEVRQRNPNARVVIITAYPSYETAVEAMRRGATDFLTKPFELEKLETSLRHEVVIPPPETIRVPAVEEPLLEEENIAPCIWTQAGIVPKRMCTLGYQCDAGCSFHGNMMKRERHRTDPRIKPHLDKLARMKVMHECRYVMSGSVAARGCDKLYNCETCEFSQKLHEHVDQQLDVKALNSRIKAENRRRKAAAKKAGLTVLPGAGEDDKAN